MAIIWGKLRFFSSLVRTVNETTTREHKFSKECARYRKMYRCVITRLEIYPEVTQACLHLNLLVPIQNIFVITLTTMSKNDLDRLKSDIVTCCKMKDLRLNTRDAPKTAFMASICYKKLFGLMQNIYIALKQIRF